jgi:hypothetical protein
MILSLGLLQGCESEKPAPLPAAGPVPPAPAASPDEAKIKKASGVGSSGAKDSTITGTGSK